MCNAERQRRRFTMDGRCMECPNHLEDFNHIFRACGDVASSWKALLLAAVFQRLSCLSFSDWMKANLSDRIPCDSSSEWSSIFFVFLWSIWRWLNDMVFFKYGSFFGV